jgi:hypothetical protein
MLLIIELVGAIGLLLFGLRNYLQREMCAGT